MHGDGRLSEGQWAGVIEIGNRAVFTVDVEDWYQTSDFHFPRDTWPQYECRVLPNTLRILDLLDTFQAKGTFFVLGCIAQQHPQLVREIYSRGHEVACHGGWHQMLTRMTPSEVKEDITWAKSLLEDLTGNPIRAFRAPSWSISWGNLWVLELLESLGFVVDSSVQPFRTPLSGMKGVPKMPFHPRINGRDLNILEVPPTVGSLVGMPVPFSGGLYLRMVPIPIIRSLLRKAGELGLAMLYTHPWEWDGGQPRLPVSWLIRFVHYYHLRVTEDKVTDLLYKFQFTTLWESVRDVEFPRIDLEVLR